MSLEEQIREVLELWTNQEFRVQGALPEIMALIEKSYKQVGCIDPLFRHMITRGFDYHDPQKNFGCSARRCKPVFIFVNPTDEQEEG